MSYDLYAYRVRSGVDVEAVHEKCCEAEEAGAEPPPEVVVIDADERLRIGRLIHAGAPTYELNVLEQGAVVVDPLDGDDEGAQWSVNERGVAVTWPYFRSPAVLGRLLKKVEPALRSLQREGFRIYDPQLGKEFEPARDVERMISSYHTITERLGDVGKDEPPVSKPWWKFW